MLRKPFSFKGRIGQSEYVFSMMLYFVYCILLSKIGYVSDGPVAGMVLLLGFAVAVWFLFAQGVKRSHDIGNSGWYTFIPLYLFYLLFKEGDSGINTFGANPRGK